MIDALYMRRSEGGGRRQQRGREEYRRAHEPARALNIALSEERAANVQEGRCVAQFV